MKSHVGKAKEETGKPPACTGAVLEIKRITRTAIKGGQSDWSQENAGCAQYVVQLTVKSPKAALGMTVFDRIKVGTPDDKDAAKPETWEVSEGGPARLRRLLTRSGTAMAKDDEEWMADAVGRTVVAPITVRGDFVNVGLYYREADKDCPVIGLADGAKAAGGPRKTRPVEVADEDPDDGDEPEDEDAPKKAPGKKAAKVAEPDEDEDDADDDDADEDEAPAKKPAKAKVAAKKAPVDDDDDDD